MHPESYTTTPAAEPARDLTAATGLIRRLYAAGWEGDYVTPVHLGTEYAVHHGTGRRLTALVDRDGQVAELRIAGGLTLDQAVGAVDAAGFAPTADPQPSGRLLAAVREVIAAGHLDPADGGDVEAVQGEAHARLVAAYEAVTGGAADTSPDYWTGLAADVHAAADRIAALAGTSRQPTSVTLDITVTDPDNTDLTAVALGERLAEGFAGGQLTVETVSLSSGGRVHQVRTRVGALRVEADTYLPGELAAAQARIAELEAQLAAGGTR
ncbi:hypothetical protein [Micromonospora sp. NBC_00421]|uniref:hypothetical protein n=1 Tax=Micromonospora sp. NBC_00421 TaxID=2975976 RepID=UPI002E20CE45